MKCTLLDMTCVHVTNSSYRLVTLLDQRFFTSRCTLCELAAVR